MAKEARPLSRAFCFSASLNGGAGLLKSASFFEPETDLMQQFFSKTFGGLTPSYYIRQLIFGSLFAAFIIFMKARSPSGVTFDAISLALVCTLLYPYSRFVYESVIGYIMGSNVFFVNAALMLTVKVITMLMCWFFAIFIAPVGLAYLYWHHSRQAS
ncbi:hypothetical protein ACIOVF_24105 [Pseudomonas sp. NPDC087612]|uniref:hypothetical protein n=1 Tax=Pseudomonas sp. NPDC087612 TaxID=3364441 RepID=UPI003814F2E4